MRLVYLIGQPGAGKTTLTRLLRGSSAASYVQGDPIGHVINTDVAGAFTYAELGWPREPFGGTDTLSMGVQPVAVRWLATHPFKTVLGEGDRLANGRFFDAMRDAGVDLQVVWLDIPNDLAAARRAGRAAAVGRPQNESWVQGRVTKIERIVAAEHATGTLTRIDGLADPVEQVAVLGGLLGL